MASEKERADARVVRSEWQCWRQPRRLVFIDETSVKINMTPLRGGSLRGQRLKAGDPAGRSRAQAWTDINEHQTAVAMMPTCSGPPMHA